jgi:hypothetical protein
MILANAKATLEAHCLELKVALQFVMMECFGVLLDKRVQ